VARCAVLLRGVNVGKHNRIAMADLRRLLGDLDGVTDVATLLQSGNAVVTTDDPDGLAERVERALSSDAGLDVRVVVRTADQLEAAIAANPFPTRAAEQPKMLHLAFTEKPADPAVVEAFGSRHGADEIAVGPPPTGDLYLSYETSSFDSPINKVLTKLDGVATTRNWNTVLKLRDMLVG
jgi:uncharacterized protein (DUF1697 family)